MIELEGLEKRFPGSERPAVAGLSLSVGAAETCALIGPSGCGKTTTLRMINRLIEPSAGRILVNGGDVRAADPVLLRRGIGYVIQSVGLFPHISVGANIATVPRLLGWSGARIRARVREMLDLVGLDPAEFAGRRPASLSGGQRQRAGVARALAADPPILLMDEPFGAADPITRDRLQADMRALLRRLGKTVILVTHDLDEALRMADRVAVMREGSIVRYDTPEGLLLSPGDDFVAQFLGADRLLKRLALVPVSRIAEEGSVPPGAPMVDSDTPLRGALALLLREGVEALGIAQEAGPPRRVTLSGIRAFSREPRPEAQPR